MFHHRMFRRIRLLPQCFLRKTRMKHLERNNYNMKKLPDRRKKSDLPKSVQQPSKLNEIARRPRVLRLSGPQQRPDKQHWRANRLRWKHIQQADVGLCSPARGAMAERKTPYRQRAVHHPPPKSLLRGIVRKCQAQFMRCQATNRQNQEELSHKGLGIGFLDGVAEALRPDTHLKGALLSRVSGFLQVPLRQTSQSDAVNLTTGVGSRLE